MQALFAEEMMVLFAILAIGTWLGGLSLRGVSLGTAGVLFTALVFGHFGMKIPKEVTNLGLLLFVYAVGLQAGPRFFRTFRRQGGQFVTIGALAVTVGALVTLLVAKLLHLPFDLAAGLYSGALTCTPALAAATDTVARLAGPAHAANIAVGYGIAYPYSMLGVVLLIQCLPRLLRRNVKVEEARWREEQESEAPALQARQFVITNPNCCGLPIREVNPHHMALVNISRIQRRERVMVATPDVTLEQGDVVTAVGPDEELLKIRHLFGEEIDGPIQGAPDLVSIDADLTEDRCAGRPLADLVQEEGLSVVVTRVRRQGLEITPRGSLRLEFGDQLHVVGERAEAERFGRLIGNGSGAQKEETSMVVYVAGLAAGIALGLIPLHLPGGMTLQLGMAGGAFLISLLLGHFGRIGRLILRVPAGAKNLSRELGLALFLAGAGTTAGAHFVSVLMERGVSLLLAGMLVTTLTALICLWVTHRLFRMNLLSTMGGLSACMTNPPALSASVAQTDADLPTLAYAGVYPVALIAKIVLVQTLVQVLYHR